MFVLPIQTAVWTKLLKHWSGSLLSDAWVTSSVNVKSITISDHIMISVTEQTVTIWSVTQWLDLSNHGLCLQLIDLRYSEWSCKDLIWHSNKRSHIMEEAIYRSATSNALLRCAISFSLPANITICPWKCHKGDISHYWRIFQWGRPKTHCSILAWIWSGDLHLRDMAGEYPRTEWHGIPSKGRSLLSSSQFYWVWSSGTQGSSWRY